MNTAIKYFALLFLFVVSSVTSAHAQMVAEEAPAVMVELTLAQSEVHTLSAQLKAAVRLLAVEEIGARSAGRDPRYAVVAVRKLVTVMAQAERRAQRQAAHPAQAGLEAELASPASTDEAKAQLAQAKAEARILAAQLRLLKQRLAAVQARARHEQPETAGGDVVYRTRKLLAVLNRAKLSAQATIALEAEQAQLAMHTTADATEVAAADAAADATEVTATVAQSTAPAQAPALAEALVANPYELDEPVAPVADVTAAPQGRQPDPLLVNFAGSLDAAFKWQGHDPNTLSLGTNGLRGTWLKLTASKGITENLGVAAILDVGFDAVTGVGNPSSSDNSATGNAPSCAVTKKNDDTGMFVAAPETKCATKLGGAQGLLFDRESTLRFYWGNGTQRLSQFEPGDRHQLMVGRMVTPLLLNDATFSPNGIRGITAPLALSNLNLAATPVRVSSGVLYRSALLWDRLYVEAGGAFGQNGLKSGETFMGRIGFRSPVLHTALALQYTDHPEGSFYVANLGANLNLGSHLTLSAIEQLSRVGKPNEWWGNFASLIATLHLFDTLDAGVGVQRQDVLFQEGASTQALLRLVFTPAPAFSTYLMGTYLWNHEGARNVPSGINPVEAGMSAAGLQLGAAIGF